jgi:hypothetical protein
VTVAVPTLRFAELAERLSRHVDDFDPAWLRSALVDELARGRVVRDGDGYGLAPGAVDDGLVAALRSFSNGSGHHDRRRQTMTENELAIAERERLVELEEVVERGLQTFVEVGSALREIRDARLYRETHETFAAYLDERWGISRSRGYRLIDGARVAELVSPMGDTPNERQARELVPLLDDEAALAETWRELRAEHGDGLTAAKVREAVNGSGKHEPPPKPQRSIEERLASVDDDVRRHVLEGKWPIEEAELVTAQRRERLAIWVGRIREAIDVLSRMAGFPIPTGIDDALADDERATLTVILDALAKESPTT